MKRLLLLVFCFLMVAEAAQARKKPKFEKGFVVLHSGDTVHCKLRFTRKVAQGLVQIATDTTQQMLTVKQVSSFSFYDDEKHTERMFYNVDIELRAEAA